MEGRLSRAQKTALLRIFKLNQSYPKRWFTECEIKHVFPTTLKALVDKGFLNTKFSEQMMKCNIGNIRERNFNNLLFLFTLYGTSYLYYGA